MAQQVKVEEAKTEEVKEKPWSELTAKEKKERREQQQREKEEAEKAAIERAAKKAAEEKIAKQKRIAEYQLAMEVKSLIDDAIGDYKGECIKLTGKLLTAVYNYWDKKDGFKYKPEDDVYVVFSIVDNPQYGKHSSRRKISIPCVKFMDHYFERLDNKESISDLACIYAKMSGTTVIIEKCKVSQLHALLYNMSNNYQSHGDWYKHVPNNPNSKLVMSKINR